VNDSQITKSNKGYDGNSKFLQPITSVLLSRADGISFSSEKLNSIYNKTPNASSLQYTQTHTRVHAAPKASDST